MACGVEGDGNPRCYQQQQTERQLQQCGMNAPHAEAARVGMQLGVLGAFTAGSATGSVATRGISTVCRCIFIMVPMQAP